MSSNLATPTNLIKGLARVPALFVVTDGIFFDRTSLSSLVRHRDWAEYSDVDGLEGELQVKALLIIAVLVGDAFALVFFPPAERVSAGKEVSWVKTSDLPVRQTSMAVENVVLARDACGIELTAAAKELIARDVALEPRPYAAERAILSNLWRETFACNPDFAGQNCFAARWQMCQQAYAEYGPDGIRVKGLIKAIIKK